MFHDAMLLILHGYPYPLPATDENIPSSATIPRYSIDAYMNCVDACYQTLKHKMNGRCGPASNFVDTTRTQIPLCRSDIDVCFQAEDTWVLCFFCFTICLTDLTVDLHVDLFPGLKFLMIHHAQIREALFCQVNSHRTKPHFPTLMQPILVGQSPHLPGSLQEALAEHHWLQRLPHRPRDSRALRIAHKEGEFTRLVGPVWP